jgi:hypothetical protein
MLRALVLSLIILATVSTMLPVGEALVEAARRAVATRQSSPRRHHSRAWWRRYRARLRRQRALAAQRRRRRWALRRRAVASQKHLPIHVSLPEALKPVELPSASLSSLAAAANIEAEVEAPAPLVDSTRLAQSAPTPQAQLAATPQLAHAPQQTPAPKQTPAPQPNDTAATPNVTALKPNVAAAVPNVAAVMPNVASVKPNLAPPPVPATSPLARLTNTRQTNAPLAVAPLVKSTTVAAATLGRDPHKFSMLPVPRNWLGVSSSLGGEMKFSLRTTDGRQSGIAVWSRVHLPANGVTDRRNKALSGVAHASLRRTVIDRMLVEGGWVVNDFEREIAGQKVFVVVAQSDAGGARRSWTYYFVEVEGQLFSLATAAPAEFADAVAADSEQTLAALGSRYRATSAAQN